nr:MAG TPA: hypothetical protein [Caudoviricetes sp.]
MYRLKKWDIFGPIFSFPWGTNVLFLKFVFHRQKKRL